MNDFIDDCHRFRRYLRSNLEALKTFREKWCCGNGRLPCDSDRNEMGANLTLAMRHVEDASMRLGKAIQAFGGGISIYDKQPPAPPVDNAHVAKGCEPFSTKPPAVCPPSERQRQAQRAKEAADEAKVNELKAVLTAARHADVAAMAAAYCQCASCQARRGPANEGAS